MSLNLPDIDVFYLLGVLFTFIILFCVLKIFFSLFNKTLKAKKIIVFDEEKKKQDAISTKSVSKNGKGISIYFLTILVILFISDMFHIPLFFTGTKSYLDLGSVIQSNSENELII